jgi:hypothetical protein
MRLPAGRQVTDNRYGHRNHSTLNIINLMKKTISIIAITVVIVGGLAFYVGMKYDQSASKSNMQERFQQLGDQQGAAFAGAGRMQRTGGGFVAGEIISKDDKSVTVKIQDGGSKIIFVSSDTKVTKNAEGSLDDVSVGTSISANGTPNQDGSISAQNIQIRPAIVQQPQQVK